MWNQCKSQETNIVAETEDLFPFGIKTASFQGVSLLVNHVREATFRLQITAWMLEMFGNSCWCWVLKSPLLPSNKHKKLIFESSSL